VKKPVRRSQKRPNNRSLPSPKKLGTSFAPNFGLYHKKIILKEILRKKRFPPG